MTRQFRRPVFRVHFGQRYSACGSTSIHYTATPERVTCPRCLARRDFLAAALRGLDLTIPGL